MSDLIDREDAMQVAFLYPFFSNALMEEIKAIPSAELEPIDMETIKAEAYNRGIDSERKRIAEAWCKAEYERGYKDGQESAERKAEWIIEKAYCDYYKYRCSNCDYYEIRPYSDCDTSNYCPNCGAKMKGADDE